MMASASLPSTTMALLCVALAGCGDSVATSASETLDTSSSSTTTDPTTDVTPTTSTSGDATTTTTGGMTGTASDSTTTTTTTGPTTGTSTDTGVSATETTSTSDTSTSTSDTSTSDTSTSDTSTSDTDTSTGDTEGEPVACLSADFPVTAALCGDGGPACTTVRSEVVSANKTFRNDMPALALRGDCQPVVLFSEAVGGYHGFYGERLGPDMWVSTPMPSPVATGSLEPDPDGEAMFAIVDDGAFGVTLWRRFAGLWTQESGLAGMNHVRAPQLLRDSAGALHVGHIDDVGGGFHEVFDGAWSKGQVFTNADIHVRLALDGDDGAHLTTWSSAEGTWKLHYAAPPAAAEVITPLGSNLLDRPHTGLALVGAEATPWVLLARRQANPNNSSYDIVLAHRTGPAAWAFETLAGENAPGEQKCAGQPGGPGESCDYDYRNYYPLALLASATEVRAIYLAIRRKGTLTSQCEFLPQQVCWWAQNQDQSTSEVRVAWPGSQPDEHQVAAVDVFTDRATARLDPAGDMHLAFYDLPPNTGPDPLVRYLVIGG